MNLDAFRSDGFDFMAGVMLAYQFVDAPRAAQVQGEADWDQVVYS